MVTMLSSSQLCMSQREFAGTRTTGTVWITCPLAGTHLRGMERPMLSLRTWKIRNIQTAAARLASTMPVAGLDMAGTFEEFVLGKQEAIIREVEALDAGGRPFLIDRFQRNPTDPSAGYGITAVLEGGSLLEKAAVNVSIISGELSEQRAKAMSARGRGLDEKGGQPYKAVALSLVFHPLNPHVPTLRADVRMFQVGGSTWYGGGADLTPAYLYEDDAREFHKFWKGICEQHSPHLYPQYKDWCDRYFYIPARKEHRGIGGIFFDDLEDGSEGQRFHARQFVEDVANGILPSWQGIIARRRESVVSEKEREWQLLRRGRYLEFNLLYDRGVRFGLDGGRVESIMVSAPPLIAWKYNVVPEPGSPEARLIQVLTSPQEWT